MKVLEILKKIFKVQVKMESSLANLTDVVILPTREEYKNNKELVNLIDKYKEIYKQRLYKKILTSHDLQIEDLAIEMNMNIDLLLNATIDESDFKKEEFENIIKYLKLKLYLAEITKLDNKNKMMLIALSELQNDIRYLFSKNKRNAIFNEINILIINMNIFASQKRALELEINSYLLNVELPEFIEEDFERRRNKNYMRYGLSEILGYENYKLNQEKRFIDNALNYLDMVSKMIKKVCPKVYDNIEFYEKSTIKKIVLYERFLEIYVYKNKNQIEELNQKIEKLKQLNITYDNYEDIVLELENINFSFQIFMKYGKKLVKDEYLYKLYNIKFNLITFEINKKGYKKFGTNLYYEFAKNKNEFEFYKKIVSNKIANIINGKSPVAHIFEENDLLKELLKILIPLFKTGRYFDFDKVLMNRELLSYLLAFDNEIRFKELYNISYHDLDLFKSYDPSDLIKDYNLNFYSSSLETTPELSLKTICWFIDLNLNMKEKIKIPSFYKIYNLYKKTKKNENMYEFPKGLIEIKRDNVYDALILKIIKNDMKNKIIVIPSTMSIFRGYWFNDIKIEGVIFKEGVEEIYDVFFSDLKKIIIPSTLAPYYSTNLTQSLNLKTLGFSNFKNSKLLNGLLHQYDSYLYPCLLSLFKIRLNRYSLNQIVPRFDKLLLYDENNNEYVINSKDIEIDVVWSLTDDYNIFRLQKNELLKYGWLCDARMREYNQVHSILEMYEAQDIYYLSEKKEELVKIIQEHLLKVIEEKTGYNIGHSKEDNKILIK
ncbi:MAG: hypothetical protein IJ068_05875 [Bacilli bacterium]|nr:hypothetical protein [Bacilli bacterium]